ncbi:MAG: polyhydroxyalkanoic acid system family protein [Gammaproteobacteria bacterium]|nr:polyhydroxyalkanoic acid system family protein [Gammaproteobacteria bacterium]
MFIRRDHRLGTEEAKRRVDKVAADLGSRFNLTSRWEGDNLRFTGSGTNGHIAVTDDSVEIRLRLGLTLMMLEGPIKLAIESSIDEYITD